jgi:hypothetical protein
MKDKILKPKKCEEKHLKFLDNLRESGITNMFEASPYLSDMFIELSDIEAKAILLYWMKTFSERHN